MATSNLLWWWLGIYKYGYSKGLLQMLWFGLQSFIDGSLICKIMVYNLAYNLCPCLANKKFQIVIHVKLDGMINPNYNPFEGSWLKVAGSSSVRVYIESLVVWWVYHVGAWRLFWQAVIYNHLSLLGAYWRSCCPSGHQMAESLPSQPLIHKFPKCIFVLCNYWSRQSCYFLCHYQIMVFLQETKHPYRPLRIWLAKSCAIWVGFKHYHTFTMVLWMFFFYPMMCN